MTCTCSTLIYFFFFNDTATTEIYTLSLHDALPISNQVLLRNPAILEGQVRGGARAQAELGRRLDVSDLETGRVFRHEEERNPLVAFRPRFSRIHLDIVREAAVRDEPFLAVQHPLVAL